VWRFRELVMPDVTDSEVVTHPEGDTPLLARPAVTRWAGIDELLLKHEGHNPTGSFKDRGMTVAVTQARRIGASAVACASTGNTSSSLAAYAAQAGLPAIVLVPAGKVSLGKLAQTVAYGARTLLVRGDFDDCLRLAAEAVDHLGVYLANSINPYRLEGQKTIVLELLQQLAWQAPDWIVVPAGNLGNTAAFGMALRQARALGLIDRVPRLAAIQAAGAAPFAWSYREGFTERHTVRAETVATAIRIGDPASYERAVRAIRETNGVVIDVPDEEILEAKAAIDAAGVGCEPASAASVAGARRLARDGVIQPRDRVVAVLTGHILKDPDILLGQSSGTEIDASIEEVARAARGAWRAAREKLGGVKSSASGDPLTPSSSSAPRAPRHAPRAVTVPGSTSNLGAGFDCVGVAIDRRLTVSLSLGSQPGRASVRREGTAAALSCAPEEDLVYRGFAAACEARGRAVPDGLELWVTSDIPIARGLGSSAAAVVAGASLANSALELGLDREEIAVLCASLEGHPDNVGPAAFGGAVLVVPRRDADASQRYIFAPITMHAELGLAFAVPDFELTTTAARAVLPSSLSHASAVEAAAKSAALVRGLATGDPALLAAAFDDVLHVPHRRALVNGYDAVVAAAHTAGAYGATLSGSGPTIVAIGPRAITPRIANAMKAQWAELGVAVEMIY
jgi:threonine synthase